MAYWMGRVVTIGHVTHYAGGWVGRVKILEDGGSWTWKAQDFERLDYFGEEEFLI